MCVEVFRLLRAGVEVLLSCDNEYGARDLFEAVSEIEGFDCSKLTGKSCLGLGIGVAEEVVEDGFDISRNGEEIGAVEPGEEGLKEQGEGDFSCEQLSGGVELQGGDRREHFKRVEEERFFHFGWVREAELLEDGATHGVAEDVGARDVKGVHEGSGVVCHHLDGIGSFRRI